MTLVLRCDVCKQHSRSWQPNGWHKVTPVGFVIMPAERNVCRECWAFLNEHRKPPMGDVG